MLQVKRSRMLVTRLHTEPLTQPTQLLMALNKVLKLSVRLPHTSRTGLCRPVTRWLTVRFKPGMPFNTQVKLLYTVSFRRDKRSVTPLFRLGKLLSTRVKLLYMVSLKQDKRLVTPLRMLHMRSPIRQAKRLTQPQIPRTVPEQPFHKASRALLMAGNTAGMAQMLPRLKSQSMCRVR